ncbi:hypothetical protein LHJ74_14580 [Streptomyces sp. N2-109]|uniref:Uncharacterized protein n=1 Tax=Streptomyces gossypii TaxID=2883101 RepID=A0ABT2JTA1_9ACTN|nr:hypothetical protein [Streptomyces gossypii]MCT2591119.1 hypothetical protein [Streptomyces gossypii]
MTTCRAVLHHQHGMAQCDLPPHDDEQQHGAWCDNCLEYGYDDPSDRLDWGRDGEDWLITP